jgi:outer membrane protein OmpA-like peptidoglycan-associated protein
VVAAPGSVAADNGAIDVNRFHPALGSETILTTDLAAVGPNWQISPQIFLHYADTPLVLTLGGDYQSDVVRDRVTGEVGVALSLLDRLQVGLSFPVTLTQSGDSIMIDPVMNENGELVNPPMNIAGAGPEDLRLSVKGVLWTDGRMGLGASGQFTVPTGNDSSFLGTRLPTFDARVLGHYRFGRLTTAVNLGWLFASTEQVLATRTGQALTFGAGAQYEVYRNEETSVALASEIFGLAHSRFESARETPVEFVVGAKSLYQRWSFFLGGGLGVTQGYGEPNFRVLAGAGFRWKPSPRPPRAEREPEPEPEREPEPTAEPPPKESDPEKDWVTSNLTLPSDVLFEYDRCAITPRSYKELRKVADALANHPEWGNVRVEGHASYEGMEKDEYNVRLSRCRARRIVRFLSYYGVEESRLSYLGFGYRCPEVPNDSEANRSKNRRVEFVRNPEQNPPRCEVPPQLEPLPKHAAEPEPYRESGGQAPRPEQPKPAQPQPGAAQPGAAQPGAAQPQPGAGGNDASKPQ